jgi:hypothetical protein
MRNIVLFGEDAFHEDFLLFLVQRLSDQYHVEVSVRPYSVRGGITRMHHEFGIFLRDLANNDEPLPDAIIAATDANCKGYVERRAVLEKVVKIKRNLKFQYLMVYAIPDPHIERWMMIDVNAFQTVFGRGCTLPALKCERGYYKNLLSSEIGRSGIQPPLGGREYVSDIVRHMDLPHAAANEPSFRHRLRDLGTIFNSWCA